MSLANKVLSKFDEKKISEESDTEKVIQSLIDIKPSNDNAEQGKFVQLMRGLAFSDDEKATAFMSKLMKTIDNSWN